MPDAASTDVDGLLMGMTYLPTQNIIGWHRHILGGSSQGYDRPVVMSLAVIPVDPSLPDPGLNQLWMVVRRRINGSDKYFIEYLEKDHRTEDTDFDDGGAQNQPNAFYVDAGLSLNNKKDITGATAANPVVITAAAHGFSNNDQVRITKVRGMTDINNRTFSITAVTTDAFTLAGENGSAYDAYKNEGEARKLVSSVSGLTHLEGQTVKVFADGLVQADQTVAAGAITLATAASHVQVGLGYTAKYQSLKLDYGAQAGTAVSKKKRISKITAILDNAGNFNAGRDSSNTQAQTPMSGTTLFTGEHVIQFNGDWGTDPRIYIESSDPTPFTCLAIVPELRTNERS